ncbi:MAG: DUF4199 domain-containing protein [Chitinophagales bacterium]|nr:DUF4199 domain-containing protein [Chitinophagales bacterium]
MQQAESKNDINSLLLQNGLIGGVFGIMLIFILYIVDASLVHNSLFNLAAPNVLAIAFMLLTLNAYRKAHHNYIDYRTGLKGAFGTAALVLLLFILGWALLHQVVDTDLQKKFIDKLVLNSYKNLKAQGLSELEIQDRLLLIRLSKPFSFRSLSLMYMAYLIINFVFSIIAALTFHSIFKENKPAEATAN